MTIPPPSSPSLSLFSFLSPCLSPQIPDPDRLLVNTRYDNLFSREAVNRGSILHPISRVDRGWSKLAAVTWAECHVDGVVSKSDELLLWLFLTRSGDLIRQARGGGVIDADTACFVQFIALSILLVYGYGSIRFIERFQKLSVGPSFFLPCVNARRGVSVVLGEEGGVRMPRYFVSIAPFLTAIR